MKLFSTVVACCLAPSSPAFPAVAPAGFWRFEAEPGLLVDSSGNGRTLESSPGVGALPANGPGDGQAAAFNGSGRLTAADSPLWHSPQFTVEVYFTAAAAATGSTQVLVAHHNNTSDQRDWHLGEAGGKLRFFKSSNGLVGTTVNAFSITANHRYFAAAIVDGGTATVKLVLKDLTAGTAAQSSSFGTAGGSFDADAPLSIGATGTRPDGTSPFTGAIDDVRFTPAVLATTDLQEPFSSEDPQVADRTKADGYKGIWFELGQKSAYGDKYSGGLGTYTVNHAPIAIHAPQVNKTFFTYGGTTAANERHLLIMVGEYDHTTQAVTRPTVVMDKVGVDDPHDNACLSLDNEGYLWVFVSGRGTLRPGFTYRSAEPYSVDGFIRISPAAGENYTYPQVWHDPERGFFHLLTRYKSGQRELFFRTSADGMAWTEAPFAQIQGHYQVSADYQNTIATFFNRHPGGDVDKRTDLYYLQTTDFGKTWTTAAGIPVTIPLKTVANPARVVDYASQGRLMYGIDLAFDSDGRPVLFYLTSASAFPGPAGEPRTYHTARWTGSGWQIRDLPVSATSRSSVTHNYAAGSIWIRNGVWSVIAPTGANASLRASEPNRFWGAGGELELWTSGDQGVTWTKARAVTEASSRTHDYVRKPLDGRGRFATFWADGNPAAMSESHLYFGNAEGTRYWELPYEMTGSTARPVEVNPPYLRWQKMYFSPAEIADPELSGPEADADRDGVSNLIEYAGGSNPRSAVVQPGLSIELQDDATGRFAGLTYPRNMKAFDLTRSIQASDNLATWEDIEAELFDVSFLQTGEVTRLSRGHRPLGPRKFYRLNDRLDR